MEHFRGDVDITVFVFCIVATRRCAFDRATYGSEHISTTCKTLRERIVSLDVHRTEDAQNYVLSTFTK